MRISTHALTWSATKIGKNGIAVAGISTHALTWSATDSTKFMPKSVKISTHALTWSATDGKGNDIGREKFQLTHSRGVRLTAAFFRVVDIHFNSRTHVECDDFTSM